MNQFIILLPSRFRPRSESKVVSEPLRACVRVGLDSDANRVRTGHGNP